MGVWGCNDLIYIDGLGDRGAGYYSDALIDCNGLKTGKQAEKFFTKICTKIYLL